MDEAAIATAESVAVRRTRLAAHRGRRTPTYAGWFLHSQDNFGLGYDSSEWVIIGGLCRLVVVSDVVLDVLANTFGDEPLPLELG